MPQRPDVETLLQRELAKAWNEIVRNPTSAAASVKHISALQQLCAIEENLRWRSGNRYFRILLSFCLLVGTVVLMYAAFTPMSKALIRLEAETKELGFRLTSPAKIEAAGVIGTLTASGYESVAFPAGYEGRFDKVLELEPVGAGSIHVNPLPLPAGVGVIIVSGPAPSEVVLVVEGRSSVANEIVDKIEIVATLAGAVKVNGTTMSFDPIGIVRVHGGTRELRLNFQFGSSPSLRSDGLNGVGEMSFLKRKSDYSGDPPFRCGEPFSCPSALLRGKLSFDKVPGLERTLRNAEALHLKADGLINSLATGNDSVRREYQAIARRGVSGDPHGREQFIPTTLGRNASHPTFLVEPWLFIGGPANPRVRAEFTYKMAAEMTRTLTAIILALLLAPGVVGQQRVEPRDIRSLVVMVHCQSAGNEGISIGTGFIVGWDSDRVYIATAQHLRESCSGRYLVQFFNATRKVASELLRFRDGTIDLNVILVQREDAPRVSDLPRNVLGRSGVLATNSPVRAVGHPAPREWHLPPDRDAVVERHLETISFQSTTVGKGSSGGPLLEGADRIIGMVKKTDTRVATASTIELSSSGWKNGMSPSNSILSTDRWTPTIRRLHL